MKTIIHNSKFIILILLAILAAAVIFMIRTDSKKSGNFKIGKTMLSVEIADDYVKQYQGLSGRENLCDNCGMLFVYKNPQIQNFIMRGMLFPLDFVFLRGDRVVEIVENIGEPKDGKAPQLITSKAQAEMVLEVNAGFISKNHIKVGDEAVFDEKQK